MEKHISQQNELDPTREAITNREYFPYKAITIPLIYLLIFIGFYSISGMIKQWQTDLEWAGLSLILFFIILILYIALFFVSAASLDDKYFSIKRTILHRTKRIQLKDISDIKYDGDYLHITYTRDAQQVSDKFDLSRLFYEDTRRCLIHDLNEALKKYGVAVQYKNRMGAEHENTL